MLKVLQVRIQEQGSCRFRNSKSDRLDRLRLCIDQFNCESIEFKLRLISLLARQMIRVSDLLHYVYIYIYIYIYNKIKIKKP